MEESLYSTYLGDTVRYDVWLPENWSASRKFTTIYSFSYGASDAEFTAQEIRYLNKNHISHTPPTLVVNIKADMDRMGYNYETGGLTQRGLKMLECIEKEIIPSMEHKYKASTFRTYMGQSYGASYGNYLFLNHPELFSGYIIISPERLSPSQPPFDITAKLAQFYGKRTTFYFLAAGAFDMERRTQYTGEIADLVKRLDSVKFNFQYHHLAEAGHNNSTAMALPLALDFIYREYNSYTESQTAGKFSAALQKYQEKVNAVYGISVDRNAYQVYQPFLSHLWQQKDTTGMLEAIDFFITKESGGRQIRDFAYSCSIVGLAEKSMELYKKAINKMLIEEMSTDRGPSTLITCYRELAMNISKDHPREGWDLLQKALAVTIRHKGSIYIDHYPDIYFYLGQFAAENNYKVKEGLNYLLCYANERKDLVNIIHFDFDKIYSTIGKSYLLLKDEKKAKSYLEMAIDLNPENITAKELLNKLSDD
ncbi:alpha/beta hydrolase-fold protein [Olivibacter domesticus]|nr:alpha/beta hydrolase-fold protein [Olivibacter domesticus]